MRRVHHLLAVLAILSSAFGSGAIWWVATLVSRQSVEVSGTSASALLWSVGAVALAAYGLQFTLRGLVRKITAALQLIAGVAFASVAIAVASDPLASTLEGVTSLTGVAGQNALVLVDSVSITGWHLSAVLSGLLVAASGALAILMPDRSVSADRFARHASTGSVEDSVSAWDSLSDGTDPTRR
jgi:hypothetical protein